MRFFVKIKYALIFVFCFQSAILLADEKVGQTFQITNSTASKLNLDKYISAVEKSDFSCFRFKKSRRILLFDDGVTLELFSIDELIKNGTALKSSCFTEEKSDLINLTLQLVNNSILIATSPGQSKSSSTQTKSK